MRLVLSSYCTKLALVWLFAFTLAGCRKDADFSLEEDRINLKWNQGFEEESLQDAVFGLEWALSSIGASNFNSQAIETDEFSEIQLTTSQLGFPNFTVKLLGCLNQKLKASEEYRVTGTIDLGRYIVLLIGASEHYYRFVGMPETLDELKAEYSLNSERGFINNSTISVKDRILYFSDQVGFNQLFVTEEIDPLSGEIVEFETVDLMENGQLRFGIFNEDGNRVNAANPSITSAGKPGKCMWCHESKIQPLFEEQLDFDGYLSALILADTLSYFRNLHHINQLNLSNGVDFSDADMHELMELLYISFMEPSAQRLAHEWNMSLFEVEALLAGQETHIYAEFPFLGNLYWRENIAEFAPFESISVSTSVREFSVEETNLLE